MPERPRFSERYETRSSQGLVYDQLPKPVRVGLSNAVRMNAKGSSWDDFVRAVCFETDQIIPPKHIRYGSPSVHLQEDFLSVVGSLPWDRFCDACEVVYEEFAGAGAKRQFQMALNQVFARNSFGYEMRDGLIERVGALTHDEAVEEAKGILKDSELAGPSQQFQKAVRFYNARPTPDCANAVKEAVGAVEGLTQILLNRPKLLLSKAVPLIQKEKGTHPALAQMIEKLYAYRGDAEGAAHGDIGERPVRLEEAELIVGVCANVIVYLARLYGRAVA